MAAPSLNSNAAKQLFALLAEELDREIFDAIYAAYLNNLNDPKESARILYDALGKLTEYRRLLQSLGQTDNHIEVIEYLLEKRQTRKQLKGRK